LQPGKPVPGQRGEAALNRILWAVAKGTDAPYPTPIHRAIFTQPVAPATP
jgi:hypothetical protein